MLWNWDLSTRHIEPVNQGDFSVQKKSEIVVTVSSAYSDPWG